MSRHRCMVNIEFLAFHVAHARGSCTKSGNVIDGGICGFFSTSNAAIRTQQGGICGFFSTSWIIGRLYKLQQTFLFRAVSCHFLLQLQFSDITIDKKHPYIGRSRCVMTSSGDILI